MLTIKLNQECCLIAFLKEIVCVCNEYYCVYGMLVCFILHKITHFMTGSRHHWTLKSKLLQTKIFFLAAHFVLKRARFSLVFPTYVQFCTRIVLL